MTKRLILLLAAGSLCACSGGASGPKDDSTSALRTQTGFCTEWAKAACNDLVVGNCNETSTETCISNQSAFCETLVPANGYSSQKAQDCIDAVKSAYADAQLDDTELDVVLHLGGACAHLVTGASKSGEDCSESNDCDTVHNYACVIKAGDATGTCQIPQIEANGEACDSPAMVCNAAAYCDGSNCLVRKLEGKTCTYDAMCADGLLCDIPSDSTDGSGTCAAKLDVRATCTDDSQCASNICIGGKCTSKVILGAGNALCDNL
jgi:hypothetical protein